MVTGGDPVEQTPAIKEETPSAALAIELELDSTVNFAMQQNDVPVVKALRVRNTGTVPVCDLLVRLWSEPEFAAPWERRVEAIEPGGVWNPGVVDLELAPAWLLGLTERVAGLVHAEARSGEAALARQSGRIEVLAYDEWSGLRSLPEIMAAFVLPNHPAIETILARAAALLGEWTGFSALSGYQSKDPKRAFQTTAAIYTALQEQGISYVSPPASFEASGQKIRLPDRILGARLATCLDLAVQAAACLEQAGLFPLIVLLEGHAFVGVWLEEECFADAATDDALRLRKRVDLGEICVFETTLATGAVRTPFDQAAEAARRSLDDENLFRCVIDIQRCRKSRIRPLPVRAEGGAVRIVAEPVVREAAPASPAAPSLGTPEPTGLPPVKTVTAPEPEETPETRLEKWKRRLLDLTLRNRLLSFRETKKTLPILCPDLATLEDALAEGEKFQIHPKPAELEADHPRSAELYMQRTGQDAVKELLRGEFEARRLRAGVTRAELEHRLLEIYREARSSMEEGGAGTLFLALGFLCWYETKTSTQPRRAPIILIPLELERHSVSEGFRIRQGDEDPRVNTTLLEMLAKDFDLKIPGLDPMPQDENGIDVRAVLDTFRRAVLNVDRWEVTEEAQIGLFSFTKFLMWRDLQERSDDLLRNKVVAHLVNTPTAPFPSDGAFPEPDRLDQTYKPDTTFCPLSSDSSQLAAVYAAAEGKSFVLEGPPGTGKSQTITNLIAHSLATGKTVLFVSEKMAALGVVHKRLKDCGLEPFCLELHSNKSHKLEVLQQLGRALERIESRSSAEWQREAARLAGLREELNRYVQALHQPRASGESVFQGTSRLIGLRDAKVVSLKWDSAEAFTREELDRLRDTVDRMQVAGQVCGGAHGNPWSASDLQKWTPALQREIENAFKELDGAAVRLEEAAQVLAPALGLARENWSLAQLELYWQIANLFLATPALTAPLLTDPDWSTIKTTVNEWVRRGRLRNTLRKELSQRYSDRLLALNLDELSLKLEQAKSTWFLPAWLKRRAARGVLKTVALGGNVASGEQLEADLKKARQLRDEEHALAQASDRAGQLLGPLWKERETDWSGLAKAVNWCENFRKYASMAVGADLERASALRAHWARLATEGHDLLNPEGTIGKTLHSYGTAYAELTKAFGPVVSSLSLETELAWGKPQEPNALGRIRERLAIWTSHMGELRAWSNWRVLRQEARKANLEPLVTAYEQGQVATGELHQVFERSFYQWWVEAVTEAEPVLAGFFSPEFERKIQQFREIDERYTQLAREEIQARLAARVPMAPERASENSEMGILQRQIQRQRGHMPVRALFQKIPNLLPRLKPCLLMSPISVAQYLDAGHPPFDLVVFDEASQIPVWDSVGAIARGREAVIVGDPKQLPPTSFFSRVGEEDTSEEDVVEDLESILDDCIGARLPWLQLRWHYRSRHESLIAFSNYHYYDNRLLTFPSPHRERGVALRPVLEGCYDKGKSRTNRAEAEAVVAEILRRLRDPELSRQSIGVVTFSLAQQTLVEDLLEEARRRNPEIEPFFSDHPEPVFIKNLENVQGDERDVILFSVCYGPDERGRISLNFGPLNRDGGERRLNVAITRARCEVLVFSTLRAEQIDLARTRARGVKDLKCFLDYAERGHAAIAEALSVRAGADFESPFEQQVGEALRLRGHEVHPQVGCSGYRIDLAVVDPAASGRYLLGIECDGANYHRAKTARDRDRLRADVLAGLGWRLHRVWSSDWWHDPAAELEKIEKALATARNGSGPQTPAIRSATPTEPKRREPETTPAPPIRPEPAAPARLAAAPQAPAAKSTTPPLPAAPPQPSAPLVYKPYPIGQLAGESDAFHQPAAEPRICELIEAVVRQEGPVSLALAARRVTAHWKIATLTQKVRDRVETVARRAGVKRVAHGQDVFYWPAGLAPEAYTAFRIPGEDESSKREARDLPPEEIANAASQVLSQQVSLPLNDLIRETARLLGYQRLGQNVEKAIRAGVELLLHRGAAREQEGMIIHQ